MSAFVHNVTLLHLLKQDTENLSLDELYSLYLETFQQVQESEKRYQETHKEPIFSFD